VLHQSAAHVVGTFGTVKPPPNPGTVLDGRSDLGRSGIRRHPETGDRHLDLLTWGLLPYWTKEPTKA
jgi:hypothetical protein